MFKVKIRLANSSIEMDADTAAEGTIKAFTVLQGHLATELESGYVVAIAKVENGQCEACIHGSLLSSAVPCLDCYPRMESSPNFVRKV